MMNETCKTMAEVLSELARKYDGVGAVEPEAQPRVVSLKPGRRLDAPDLNVFLTQEQVDAMIHDLLYGEVDQHLPEVDGWTPDFAPFDPALHLPGVWELPLTEAERTSLREVLEAPDEWVRHVQIFPPSVL